MGGDSDVGQPPLKRQKLSKPSHKTPCEGSRTGVAATGSAALMARSICSNDGETVGSHGQIRKVEFVRIIEQALFSLGYQQAGAVLEEESGIRLQSPAVQQFREDILAGRWDECVATLSEIGVLEESTYKAALFLVLQQKFLESLEASNTTAALETLRSEISPLGVSTSKVHQLASFIVCFPEDLLAKAQWKGAGQESRQSLLEELQQLLPPSIMVPERRLEHLIEVALQVQREACVYHNTLDHVLSLYSDHRCSRDQIPTRTLQVVEGDSLKVKYKFTGHSKPVSFVAWSPDDTMLLTCGNEEVVKLWDISTGQCKYTYDKPNSCFTSCAWFPDGKRFVSGGGDKCIYMWDLEGHELEAWKGARMPRINDLAITTDGSHMVSICDHKNIRIYNLEEKTERVIEEEKPITSLSVSKNGRYLLVNLVSQEIHLWDISAATKDLPKKYRGHKQGRYVIRSCFGGTDYAFIVSGSEDSQVYIWHRWNGELLDVLSGHSGTVNSVSWNPVNPHMFASASDDHTIRIWGLSNRPMPKKHDEKPGSSNGFDHLVNGGTRDLLENLRPFNSDTD
ncbi:WD repeat-containing protein 26 homolog isoform X2 [Physcomitrium patens]|uniref:WD repeat-containing protein 26 homolog isoform X2 n=1 Tax=Physcomitrium patens TaxID=3218 RepID=UPI000D15E148|nr:WD repeat-containing protein 26 homolog isoform X2 [Physcomitrium patens]|eukprot:XP_024388495.1 WD repeat-containing protein 26 homolog isoform X2 [Physcomitrella patens]